MKLPKKGTTVAIDTETVSLENKTLVGFSFAYDDIVYYIPVKDKYLNNVSYDKAKEILIYLLKNCHVVFHNSAFDLTVISHFGVKIPDKLEIDDTLIIANLVNEHMKHGLKKLVKKYFNYQMTELKELLGSGKKRISFDECDNSDKVKYAEDDAKYTLKLYYKLKPLLDKNSKEVYEKIERPLLQPVADMHIHGIRVNVKKVLEIGKFCFDKINSAEEKLRILMGTKINFNSPKQLKKYFIGQRHLPVLKKTPAGAPSMDSEVLKEYAKMDSSAQLLLEYRKYSKIYTTFIPALTPTKWDEKTMTGLIYASFNQAGTVSGRFSSSRPNCQNIPHDDALGLREVVIPDDGDILIGADFSQVELRVLAHFSQDRNLLQAYNEQKDIHQQTADALGIGRYDAKTINFGLVYGMGAKTLGKKLDKPYDEAQRYVDKYFQTYPGVKRFWEKVEKDFRTFGYVQTFFGRKRRKTPYFHTKDDYEQGAEIRSVTNHIIQGTAADLIKIAMKNMAPQLKTLGAKLILTVHDEVLVSCPIDKAQEAKKVIEKEMIEAGKDLSVRIEVDCKFGRTWAEAHGDGIKLEEIKCS